MRRDRILAAATDRRWRRALACGALAVMVAVAALGCSTKKNPLKPNVTPETTVFVDGPVDTVSHRVHLYWYGTDPDGDVVAYRMRFVYPPPANQDPAWDTLHCDRARSCTDSLFTMFTGDSATVTPRFEIAAIDDDGATDPTPAVQTFLLSNLEPQVVFTNPYSLADTTYAAATITWDVIDPDGGGPGLRYRVWLTGNEGAIDSTDQNTFTIPSRSFLENGTYLSGPRTVNVQAVDDGGRSGPVSSMTWFVRAPAQVLSADNRGELLIIDDVPTSSSTNATFDGFYLGVVQESLATTRYSIVRPQIHSRMFRTVADFAQTLRLFKAVLWYRGIETTVSPLLRSCQDSLGVWIESGGNLYLDGLYLIEGLNTPGALRVDFVTRYLGSSGLLHNLNSSIQDSTAGWSNRGGARTGSFFRSSVYADTMRAAITAPGITGQTGGIRAFAVLDTSEVALWAMDGQLQPPNVGFEAPVGVTIGRYGGRVVVLGMPVRIGLPGPATILFRRMLFGRPGVPGVVRPNGALLSRR